MKWLGKVIVSIKLQVIRCCSNFASISCCEDFAHMRCYDFWHQGNTGQILASIDIIFFTVLLEILNFRQVVFVCVSYQVKVTKQLIKANVRMKIVHRTWYEWWRGRLIVHKPIWSVLDFLPPFERYHHQIWEESFVLTFHCSEFWELEPTWVKY